MREKWVSPCALLKWHHRETEGPHDDSAGKIYKLFVGFLWRKNKTKEIYNKLSFFETPSICGATVVKNVSHCLRLVLLVEDLTLSLQSVQQNAVWIFQGPEFDAILHFHFVEQV